MTAQLHNKIKAGNMKGGESFNNELSLPLVTCRLGGRGQARPGGPWVAPRASRSRACRGPRAPARVVVVREQATVSRGPSTASSAHQSDSLGSANFKGGLAKRKKVGDAP